MSLMAAREEVKQIPGYGWPATFEDLEALPDNGLRAELVDGDIVVPSAGNLASGHRAPSRRHPGRHWVPLCLLVDPFPGPVKLSLFQLAGDSYDQIAQVEAGTPLSLPDPFNVELDTARLR